MSPLLIASQIGNRRRLGLGAALVVVAVSGVAVVLGTSERTGVAAEKVAAAEVRGAQLQPAKPQPASLQPAAVRPAAAASPGDATTNDVAASETTTGENAKSRKLRNLPAFTPEREAAALTFVAAQHPELTPLLAHVKKSRPSEYEKVIRKLFVDSERLAQSRESQPQRYELELKNWQLESRIQLLVAKLTMDRNSALEKKLREALAERLEVRRQLLVLDHDRHVNRAESIAKQLAELELKREKMLEEQFEKALSAPTKKGPTKK